MPYKNKSEENAYKKGYDAGLRIKGEGRSFDQLIGRYDKLRKEHNKRVKLAVMKAIEELNSQNKPKTQ